MQPRQPRFCVGGNGRSLIRYQFRNRNGRFPIAMTRRVNYSG
ncbi:MAG: hypothetical protein R3D55_25935 [Chloroflexota bacterium]